MSIVGKPTVLDSTGQLLVDTIRKRNSILALLSFKNSNPGVSQYRDIQRIVQNGMASKAFGIGDQIFADWTDTASDETYKVPGDIVDFKNVTLESGEVVPGMLVQWHYCTPFGIQFDNYEAFYAAETAALPAGTYNITLGDNWGDNAVKGKTYQFTLTQELPVDGQLCGFETLNSTAPSNWKVKSYTSPESMSPIETVSITEGNEGTNLGTMSFAAKDGVLNSMQSVAYGYNHWGKGAVRQWLNSPEPKGAWWKPQHKWDRPPAELSTKAGFMSGFTDDFLSIIKPVRVRTAANTVTDDGALYDTYDRFFIPSLEEMFIKPQIAGEGEAWAYWKEASKRTEPIPWNIAGAAPITYALNAKTSPQFVRLRSAYRGCSHLTWFVSSTGGVSGDIAYYSNRLSPACVIY